LLIDRNLIKFNLTSQTKSLQPPGVFVDAHDVLFFDKNKEGKDDAFFTAYTHIFSVAVFIKHLVSDLSQTETFQVILDRSEPGVIWCSWWSSPVGRWPLYWCRNDAVVGLTQWIWRAVCHKKSSLLVIIHRVMVAWWPKRSKDAMRWLRR